jgi:putative glutathione S-transferase
MGELIEGTWHRSGVETVLSEGAHVRPPSVFRNWIVSEGDNPPGARLFQAEHDRYHLYVSLACPWAHRTLIMRSLKGLAGIISISVVHWLMGEDGWTFEPGPGVIPDTVNAVVKLHQLYRLAEPANDSDGAR